MANRVLRSCEKITKLSLCKSKVIAAFLYVVINVPSEILKLESFLKVHHLTSVIRGKLKKDKNWIDLLKACWPGGSITGAPKLRSMEIIEELEPVRRNAYCGAIGYISFDGDMATSVAIRMLAVSRGRIYMQLGGAIGNLVDRVRLGYVVDFIDVGLWPVFNIADSAIVIGLVGLVWSMIFLNKKTEGDEYSTELDCRPEV